MKLLRKLLRIAAVGAALAWFLDRRRGSERRSRALGVARGLAAGARAMLEGIGGARGGEGARPKPDSPGAIARAPRPEVHEVKSPAELERGTFSARPEPTFASRVDRDDLRGAARPHGPLPDELEPTAEEWRNDDVTPRVDLASPPQGSRVTEAHLGVYVPRDDAEAPGRGLRASDEETAAGTAGPRDPERE